MAKINLNNVTSPQNVSVMNANFQKIATELNNKVLYRDNTSTEPNQMKNDLDMDGNRIYNLPAPIGDNEPVRKVDLNNVVGGNFANAVRAPEPLQILPVKDARANKLLSFDAQGQPVASLPQTDSATSLRIDLADPATGPGLIGFVQYGVGAVPYTLQQKEYQIISVKDFGAVGNNTTNDQVALVNAVAAAAARGANLYWPEGVYVSSSNIPLFHSVKHTGNGAIRRGTDVFSIDPSVTTVNRLYTSTVGLDTNDGLTPSQPVLTLQHNIDVLSQYGPVLKGEWVIQLASGTYSRGRFPDTGLLSDKPIALVGPVVNHPNVPTAVISEGADVAAFGLLASNGTRIKVSNILVSGFSGSVSSSGIRVNTQSSLYTENVHFSNCYYGVSGLGHAHLDIKGGIFSGCGFLNNNPSNGTGHAIRGLFHTKFEIGTQNAGTLTLGPVIQNCAGAARVQELCTGHFDFVDVKDCNSGLRLLVNSRLNVDGSSFVRILNSAIYLTQGCHVDTTVNNVFGVGADINGRNLAMGYASTGSAFGLNSFNTGNSATAGVLKTSFPAMTVNTTTNTLLDEIVVSVNALNDTQYTGIPSKRLKATISGRLTGSTGTFKRLIMRIGATPVLLSFSAGTTGVFQATLMVYFNGPNRQYVILSGGAATFEPTLSESKLTEVTTSDMPIQLQAFVNNSADSIIVECIEWEQLGF